jgi:hypothetical protein
LRVMRTVRASTRGATKRRWETNPLIKMLAAQTAQTAQTPGGQEVSAVPAVSASKTEISGHTPKGVNGDDAAPAPDGDPRDCGPMPECLIRRVPLDRRPALGPPDDSLDDFQ